MNDIFLAARIAQLRHHPLHNPAAFKDLAKNDRTRIPGQTVGAMLYAKRTVEAGCDWL